MRSSSAAFLLLLAPAIACSGGAGSSASATMTASDAGTTGASTSTATTGDDSTGDASTTETTGAPVDRCDDDAPADGEVAWDRGQPPIAGCEVRGVRDYRAIIHLHSPHSHDACDGDPQPGGALDEDCLQDLRDALCTTRVDVAFLSDHPAHAEEATIEEMALHRGSDELVKDDEGRVVGNWLVCDSGHRTLLIPGVESGSMMPLGLSEHPPAGTYGESSPASFAAAKAAGAALWVAHTEGRDVAELATLGLDGIEFYQLHANLDPEIREEDLGLEGNGFLADTLPFFYPVGDDPPQPDLASVAFVLPNEPSIAALETLGQAQRLTISGGTDAHQNVASTIVTDGERVDSYRRMMRWFNNRLRIDGALTVASAKAALVAGRNHIVFESFGTPQGFDLYAQAGGVVTEMGAEVTLSPGMTIEATLPRLDRRSPRSAEAPAIRGVLYRADGDGRSVLAEWDSGTLSHPVDGPGVYRVEVLMTPRHLDVHLGSSAPLAAVEKPWIYSGAIFVRE